MAVLADVCEPGLVASAVASGLVLERSDGSARILNYTRKAMYERMWNPATRACRGLILDTEDQILARPFPKFFSPAEPDAPPLPGTAQLHVTTKLDGVLGIAYRHPSDQQIRIATRGSLASDAAREATRIWTQRYSRVEVPHGLTPLFEIISSAHRIVIDYHDMHDLVLLAVIDNETGADALEGALDWPGPKAPRNRFESFAALARHVASDASAAAEGYVVRFAGDGRSPDLRFKLKYPSYVVAHRAVFGLSSRRVWEATAVAAAAAAGAAPSAMVRWLRLSPKTIDGLLAQDPDPVEGLRRSLPEEMWAWYDAAVTETRSEAGRLIVAYERIAKQAGTEAEGSQNPDKAFAEGARRLAASAGLHPGPALALRRGRSDAPLAIWAQTRPSGLGAAATFG